MSLSSSLAFSELQRWVDMTNQQLKANIKVTCTHATVLSTQSLICSTANQVKYEYPYYSSQLIHISNNLFLKQYNTVSLNLCAFGSLYTIIHHLASEPNNELWRNIHPQILSASQGLFCDGYYDSAAEKAVLEVETTLRNLFSELKPNSKEPTHIADILNALLAHDSYYAFDTTTVSGQNYHKGIRQIFDGFFSAYRNASFHRASIISKHEAFERISMASQLIYFLEEKKK